MISPDPTPLLVLALALLLVLAVVFLLPAALIERRMFRILRRIVSDLEKLLQ